MWNEPQENWSGLRVSTGKNMSKDQEGNENLVCSRNVKFKMAEVELEEGEWHEMSLQK